jgi:hypothetical protein
LIDGEYPIVGVLFVPVNTNDPPAAAVPDISPVVEFNVSPVAEANPVELYVIPGLVGYLVVARS